MNKKTVLVLFCSFMVFVPSYARYRSAPLKKLHARIDVKGQEYLAFDYKVLSTADCKKYFNSKTILKKGYQPIQISFINNTRKSIAVSPSSFSVRCAHPQDVANSLHRDGIARGIGFGIGALWFFPLIIPAFVQGFGAEQYNIDMDIDFAQKAFKDQVVPPYSIVDGVVFASRSELLREFTLTVKDINQQDGWYVLSLQKPRQLIAK